MINKRIEKLKSKSRRISVKEGSAYAFMDGFGLRYITPYALSLGATNFHIGLLNSIPTLMGNFSQLLTLKLIKNHPRKKVVFFSVLLQSIMWLALILIGAMYFIFKFSSQLSSYLLILTYTLLIAFGAIGGPAWSSWMKDLVTINRGKYFGDRNKTIGIIALSCLIIAGFILDYFKKTNVFIGFIILFSIAFLGRFFSSLLMLKQYEPKLKNNPKDYFTLVQFIKKMRHNNFGRFVIYYSLISFTVAIASPFFAVYMLGNLGFSYVQYMVVTLSASVSNLLTMPLWGRFADKHGTVSVMKKTGKLISIIPFLWLIPLLYFTNSIALIPFLIIIELLSGIFWAGFGLSAGNFIYDAVSREKLAICVSYFGILNAIGVLIGSLLGGIIASFEFTFLSLNTLLFIFLLSGILRLIVHYSINTTIKEVREVIPLKQTNYKKEAMNTLKLVYNHGLGWIKPRPI